MSRRRRRRGTSISHRLYRFFRDRMPAPRRRCFRVVNRRRFIIAQCVLALVVVGALSLSASVIIRSIRTARLNKRLVVMHTVSGDQLEVEIAAPPVEPEIQAAKTSGDIDEWTFTCMPDGTPIQISELSAMDAASVSTFHRTDLDILSDIQS